MATPNHTGGIDLEGAAELWQTPNSRDADKWYYRKCDSGKQQNLSGQASERFSQFPTPAARDHRSERGGAGDYEPLQSSRGSVAASHDRALFPPGPADREQWSAIIRERPYLAPAVEYKVCRVVDGDAGRMDFARADQLRGLGNMVVPLQGAAALIALLKRFE